MPAADPGRPLLGVFQPGDPFAVRANLKLAIFTIAAAASALILVAAGCSGSPSGHAAQSNQIQLSGALAFSGCMRSHGVPNFADPNGSGQLPKETPEQLGVSGSRLQTAQNACRHFFANGGLPGQAALQQSWVDFLSFARCMRRHGVPNWPDPTRYPRHPDRPTFDLQVVGIRPNLPPTNTEIHDCLPLLRGLNPQHLGEGGS
jgi:hypothetical protein